MQPVQFNISFNEVEPNLNAVLSGMGYGAKNNHEYIINTTQKLIKESKEYVKISGGYKIFENEFVQIANGKMTIENTIFDLDNIISKQLIKSSSIAFILTTLGKEFDLWINKFFKNGEPVLGYIADTIGSEMVENAADIVENIVTGESQKSNMTCTNRYSPGYCGWNVSEQHKFFSFFPKNFCGIHLSETALMHPVKSVSAVIGIGKECEKKEYYCSLCSLESCYKRNRQEIVQN